jgi:hypothetical protein
LGAMCFLSSGIWWQQSTTRSTSGMCRSRPCKKPEIDSRLHPMRDSLHHSPAT